MGWAERDDAHDIKTGAEVQVGALPREVLSQRTCWHQIVRPNYKNAEFASRACACSR
eukprot:CAMPEP_0176131316 /NCGR_PEP_ID=MMETSP0120_2-20121206/66477_1 /TAXON_ID=160619 /ORGANISM="Kryptoperidinium foliaceum, Strain CCMP 1326" /LENGTH=56 /DNA_ID=CAMNT_0017466687 /DNA_START=73 /DNA_END=240 /DNA_ORIENTATION=+